MVAAQPGRSGIGTSGKPVDEPVRLRGHHLLCLLTYVGHGYSPAFVANLDAIAARLSRAGDVIIVSGPDDICRPWQNENDAHCHEARIDDRDQAALHDVGAVLGHMTGGRTLRPGDALTLDRPAVALLRAAFSGKSARTACAGCQWFDVCSTVAASAFDGAKLSPESSGPADAP